MYLDSREVVWQLKLQFGRDLKADEIDSLHDGLHVGFGRRSQMQGVEEVLDADRTCKWCGNAVLAKMC